MTIVLEMSEKNSGLMNSELLYDNARNALWDGDTMTIDIRRNGDEMSMSLDKADFVDLLGRSCNKSPLEKRLGRLLTTRRKTRGHKQRRCRTAMNKQSRRHTNMRHTNMHRRSGRKQTKSSARRRRTSGLGRSCRRPTKRRQASIMDS